ncbi:hypothetical protein [Maritimibacter dapengensis]|uniref:Uncharacterized protein n=1 Tax=Maritimibacter dapengensis TaxID=2836868 RepID=A0ABS6SZV5_9RHOB|nr:hypothetical protein [Maritimibacter dapengensis]MBV7378517.1 hypothetical protein [Maritimibacter dapengensis]
MNFRMRKSVATPLALLALSFFQVGDVQAQTSASELIAKATGQSEEIGLVLETLQNGDKSTQYALVKLLLEEQDPALRRAGREFALFSTDPVLRNLAIVSVFNTNSALRLEVYDAEDPSVYGWVEQVGGASNGERAAVVLETLEFDGSCWGGRTCRWQVRGDHVQFTDKFNSRYAQADLTLGSDGVLRGAIVMNTGRAQLAIDLKE